MISLPNITSADLLPLVPAIILAAFAILLVLTEVFRSGGSRAYQAVLAAFAAVAALGVSIATASGEPHTVFLGFAVQDPFSSLVTAVVCVGLLLAVLLSSGFLHERKSERGEFYALMLFAAAGMSLLAVSNE